VNGLICLILDLATLFLIAWVILSYVVNFGRLSWGHPVRTIYDGMSRAVNPVLVPIRRILPPVRVGAMGLDLSPMVLFFAIIILNSFVC
jgi:YggT family protein